MAFCTKCGKSIADGAKFCGSCGAAVTTSGFESAGQRKTVYDGEIHKCPNCGEVLESFVVNCPACGHELRGAKKSMSAKEFSAKLDEIERSRPAKNLGAKPKREELLKDLLVVSETDERKISLIRSFVIPNTKEDLLEFLVLASSNINMKSEPSIPEKAVSDAWEAKFEQTYEKARLSFGHTKDFEKIQALYQKKKGEIKQIKKKKVYLVIGILAFTLVTWGLLIWGGLRSADAQAPQYEAENERLKIIAEEVYESLADENYVLARAKAASLVYLESHTSYEKLWDKTREELLALIDAAENGAEVDIPETNESSSSAGDDLNNANDESTLPIATTEVPISKFAIEKGSEYTYGHDEWGLYSATAISDSIINIEKWGKDLSTEKTFDYEYEVGSFKINDAENGFAWVDDQHTAFVFVLQDKNSDDFKESQTVVFTIAASESNINKGTNYDKDGGCYSYQNDDWHLYRAIQLTETTVKIECWYRSMSIFDFNYGYDLCIIDLRDKTTDFEWTDNEKTAFTITMQDPENSDFDEPRFVAFAMDK